MLVSNIYLKVFTSTCSFSMCVCSNDGVFEVALRVHVQVYSNGRVTWTPPALFRSSCAVKVRQKCHNLLNIQSSPKTSAVG